jgi:two-component system alkaline phosphatase synthesis response regulator PhoP
MSPAHILIIDDEPGVRIILEGTLKVDGYVLETAVDGEDALQKIAANSYDLILLDLHLGQIDGLQVLEATHRQDPTIVVIILTGYASMESAVNALRLGAFDYLFKPVMPDVIRQRVKAGLESRQAVLEENRILEEMKSLQSKLTQIATKRTDDAPLSVQDRFIRKGGLVVDLHHYAVTLNGRLVDLTTTEYEILLYLIKAAPNPCTATELLAATLKYDTSPAEARETIKWYIHHLRRKVEPNPKTPQFIVTVRNKGYFWDETAVSAF